MTEPLRCVTCEERHDDWSKDGEHHVRSKHHAGVAARWECGRCGEITEVVRP